MLRQPPRSTRTDTLFPYTTLFRSKVLDLGFVGEPTMIDPKILASLQHSDIIPVIAPIGIGPDGATYNINADTVAGAIAAAAGAARLLMLPDVTAVLDKNGALIPELNTPTIQARRAAGTHPGPTTH